MNILISNDDGISSVGIKKLAEVLSRDKNNKIYIIAPNKDCSGYSHKISLRDRISIKKVQISPDYSVYTLIGGTPSDCVKYGMCSLGIKFDLVLSGINIGGNLGTAIFYSGTFAAALEGACQGAFAVALSSSTGIENDFEKCAEYFVKILPKLQEISKGNVIWNINFPDMRKGEEKCVFARLGILKFKEKFIKSGFRKWTLTGEPEDNSGVNEDSDMHYSEKGYITLTPVLFDRTDYSLLNSLKEGNNE